MEGITYSELKTNLPALQQLDEMKVVQKQNEHATLYISGICYESAKDALVTEMLEGKDIELFSEKNGKTIFFKGLIQKSKVTFQGGIYMLELWGISYSFLTDVCKKSASYQDIGATYKSIFKKLIKQYQGGDVKDLATKDKATGQLLVQYEETDWEFMKRLASHFNMALYPNATLAGPKLYMGTPAGVNRGEIACHKYKISKDLLSYKRAAGNTNPSLKEMDAMCYKVKVLDNYEIGDKVTYQGKSLCIKSKTATLENGMVRFSYELCSQNGMTVERIVNERLTGLSLRGTVLESVKDKVKVHLAIDPAQETGKAYEFPYSTVYTAEGQSGWYCMPEEGDTVLVNFPSHDEAGAVAINSYRQGSQSDKTGDPKTKYFRTANGKELKFSPEEIVITCIQGKDPKTGENKTVYIRLNQDNGVEIMSTEPIAFTTDKGISLTAEDKIEITAKNELTLHCKKSQIKMDTKVDICGPDVRIN